VLTLNIFLTLAWTKIIIKLHLGNLSESLDPLPDGLGADWDLSGLLLHGLPRVERR